MDRPSAPKRSGGLGGFTAVAAGLGTLALILGLKRKDKREKSSYGSGSYTDDYYTSASEKPIHFLHSTFY